MTPEEVRAAAEYVAENDGFRDDYELDGPTRYHDHDFIRHAKALAAHCAAAGDRVPAEAVRSLFREAILIGAGMPLMLKELKAKGFDKTERLIDDMADRYAARLAALKPPGAA